jgi:Ni,Fe-hydrogenase III small subunit/ferredoxin
VFQAWRVRVAQGEQTVPDLRTASPPNLRGLLRVDEATPCAAGCTACVDVCAPRAITLAPVRVDLGRCTFEGDCVPACPVGRLSFTNEHRTATTSREGLVVGEGKPTPDPAQVSAELRRLFGRSFKLRSVSAGGCNGCELEVNALANVNFDLQRYGVELVASPRHADGLVLTGPITSNMAPALERCWEGIPDPKVVIAVGACAISGGVFDGSPALDRAFLGRFTPQLYVPGCPPHPLTIACGILDLLGRAG